MSSLLLRGGTWSPFPVSTKRKKCHVIHWPTWIQHESLYGPGWDTGSELAVMIKSWNFNHRHNPTEDFQTTLASRIQNTESESRLGGGNSLYLLYGDVPLGRVWFSGIPATNMLLSPSPQIYYVLNIPTILTLHSRLLFVASRELSCHQCNISDPIIHCDKIVRRQGVVSSGRDSLISVYWPFCVLKLEKMTKQQLIGQNPTHTRRLMALWAAVYEWTHTVANWINNSFNLITSFSARKTFLGLHFAFFGRLVRLRTQAVFSNNISCPLRYWGEQFPSTSESNAGQENGTHRVRRSTESVVVHHSQLVLCLHIRTFDSLEGNQGFIVNLPLEEKLSKLELRQTITGLCSASENVFNNVVWNVVLFPAILTITVDCFR